MPVVCCGRKDPPDKDRLGFLRAGRRLVEPTLTCAPPLGSQNLVRYRVPLPRRASNAIDWGRVYPSGAAPQPGCCRRCGGRASSPAHRLRDSPGVHPFGSQAARGRLPPALGFASRPFNRFAFVEDERPQAHSLRGSGAGQTSAHEACPADKDSRFHGRLENRARETSSLIRRRLRSKPYVTTPGCQTRNSALTRVTPPRGASLRARSRQWPRLL